jgi:hypothetical protein
VPATLLQYSLDLAITSKIMSSSIPTLLAASMVALMFHFARKLVGLLPEERILIKPGV